MAVGFQRRNVGRLTDLDMGGGTEAFRDFVENPIALAMADQTATPSNAPAAPVEGEVLPPEAAQGGSPINLSSAEQAAQFLIQQAEKQRAAAGNPLNRGLSILGGVLGAPVNILDGILSGGDMSRVTAPFRPQQNADSRFFETVMGINSTLADVRKQYAQIGASNASAVASAMQSQREQDAAGWADLGRFSANLLYVPADQRAQVAAPALEMLLKRYPSLEPVLSSFTDLSDASLVRAASFTKDEAANKMVAEYVNGNKTINFGEGSGAVIYSRPGAAPQVFDRSAADPRYRTLSPAPGISTTAVPFTRGPSAADVIKNAQATGTITPEQMQMVQQELQLGPNGAAAMGAWLKDNNITVAQPQAPAAAPAATTPPPPPGFVVEQ